MVDIHGAPHAEAGVEQLHERVDFYGRSCEDENESQGDSGSRGSTVGRVKSGLSGAAELHKECDDWKDEEGQGKEEGHDEGGDDRPVSGAPGGPAVPDRAGVLVEGEIHVDVGQGSGRDGQADAEDPRQRDGPLVHAGPADHGLAVFGQVGLLLPEPVIEEEEEEDEDEGVGGHGGVVEKRVRLAQERACCPLHKIDRLKTEKINVFKIYHCPFTCSVLLKFLLLHISILLMLMLVLMSVTF